MKHIIFFLKQNSIIKKPLFSKRFIALLEVLIALGLASLVLSALLFFYYQVSTIDKLSEQAENEAFRKSYLQNRLNDVLPKAIVPNKKNDALFYTAADFSGSMYKEGTTSLVFSYDNGIDLDKLFSNRVFGRLYLDQQNNLVLATWPTPTRWPENGPPPMKREILMENVSDIWFEFFVPPDKDRSKVVKKNQQELPLIEPLVKGGWVKEWRNEYYTLPGIVKTYIMTDSPVSEGKKTEEIVFSFPLSNSEGVIIYNQ